MDVRPVAPCGSHAFPAPQTSGPLVERRLLLHRLHLGCGPCAAAGWLNVDRRALPGVDVVCDVRGGLPLRDASFDCAVAIHVLQDLPWLELAPALRELHRVLRPGGVLRLGLPDLARAIDAWRRADAGYFHVPDADAASVGGKLMAQATWYGSVRTPFLFDGAAELLERAGFVAVRRCAFRTTGSALAELVRFDNRPRESLFVEAERP